MIGAGIVAENNKVWRVFGQLGADFLDIGDEAHVEHPVSLVDHEQVATGKQYLATTEQVHQPSGRGDQHIDASAKGLHLVAHRYAADQQGHR